MCFAVLSADRTLLRLGTGGKLYQPINRTRAALKSRAVSAWGEWRGISVGADGDGENATAPGAGALLVGKRGGSGSKLGSNPAKKKR